MMILPNHYLSYTADVVRYLILPKFFTNTSKPFQVVFEIYPLHNLLMTLRIRKDQKVIFWGFCADLLWILHILDLIDHFSQKYPYELCLSKPQATTLLAKKNVSSLWIAPPILWSPLSHLTLLRYLTQRTQQLLLTTDEGLMGGSEGRQEPVDDGSVVSIYGRRVDVLVDKGE